MGPVRHHESERKVCKLFIDAWDRYGPSRGEINDVLRRRRGVQLTPAQAASAVDRMASLVRDTDRIAGAQ